MENDRPLLRAAPRQASPYEKAMQTQMLPAIENEQGIWRTIVIVEGYSLNRAEIRWLCCCCRRKPSIIINPDHEMLLPTLGH